MVSGDPIEEIFYTERSTHIVENQYPANGGYSTHEQGYLLSHTKILNLRIQVPGQ